MKSACLATTRYQVGALNKARSFCKARDILPSNIRHGCIVSCVYTIIYRYMPVFRKLQRRYTLEVYTKRPACLRLSRVAASLKQGPHGLRGTVDMNAERAAEKRPRASSEHRLITGSRLCLTYTVADKRTRTGCLSQGPTTIIGRVCAN